MFGLNFLALDYELKSHVWSAAMLREFFKFITTVTVNKLNIINMNRKSLAILNFFKCCTSLRSYIAVVTC